MASSWQTFPIEFKGGLISNLSPLQQGANAVGSATVLQNFESNKEGGYSKIRGYDKYSSTVIPGTGPVLGVKAISANRVVAGRKNSSNLTQWYYSTGAGWTSMATGAQANAGKARSASFNLDGTDKVVFVDGNNYPGVYSTSGNSFTYMTSSNSTDVEGAKFVAIFKDTAFYAKGNNLFFTVPSTIDNFGSGSGAINVGNLITGIAVFREQLIIFTDNTVKKLTGSTSVDFALSSITDRIGCVNGDTIQEVGGDIMYLAPDGLRLLSATDRIGDFGLDVASDPIAKDANIFLSSTPIFSSIVLREKAQYRVFAYIGSENSADAKGLIGTKKIAQGAAGIEWSSTKGIKAYVADSVYSLTNEVIVFGNDDGYIYRMDNAPSLDGANIEAIYESPYMSIQDPLVRKTFYKMALFLEPKGSMSLDLNIKYDFGSADGSIPQPETQQISSTGSAVSLFGASSSIFNTSKFGGELDKLYTTSLVGSGKTVAIRIEDNSTNPTFTLDTALLEYKPNDRQ